VREGGSGGDALAVGGAGGGGSDGDAPGGGVTLGGSSGVKADTSRAGGGLAIMRLARHASSTSDSDHAQEDVAGNGDD